MTFELGKRRRRGAVRPSPLFLTVLGVTALGAVLAWTETTTLVCSSGTCFVSRTSRLGDVGVFIFVLGGWIASVCVHEFAHAYAAYRAGDRSVEARGYLTLNPFKYTHPVLSILLPLVAVISGGFALPGGAVYLHPHSFRTRAQRSLAAAAGPLVNVVLAVVFILVARHNASGEHARFWAGLAFLGLLQVTASVLNLLPVPGLDGYAIIEPYLDPETVRIGEKVKPWGLFIVLVLLLWARQARDVFFKVIDAIYRLIGGTDVLHEVGYTFFRWWVKHPA